ncbi:hypothetical protein MMC19_004133 [Ptychographa xylographoides]|nr:hypothetical protein [Ptychographa xylographoides]
MLSSIPSLLFLAAGAAAKIYYAGVAESSGEFGVYSSTATKGTGLPGRFGVDYAFINESAVDVFVDQDGINTFRVAFLLERMCPLAYGLGSKFNETHFGFYKDAINYITRTKGAYAILDPHNYMRYNNPSQQPGSGSVIGNTSDPTAATTKQFEIFWAELASRFVDNPKVIFGIMNEPHDMPTELVLQNDQAAINGIRSVGAKQMILAPGNGYTGGHAWLQSSQGDAPSGDYLYMIRDPINNTAIDIHEYLDYDFSGQHQVCNQSGPANLAPLTAWLKTYKLKAMITEFGGDNNTMCYNYIDNLIRYMDDNPEYIGWTMWAAGPLWGSNSPCCNDGAQWGSLEPGSTAADGSPSLYYTVWLRAVQYLVPANLVRSGISSIHG